MNCPISTRGGQNLATDQIGLTKRRGSGSGALRAEALVRCSFCVIMRSVLQRLKILFAMVVAS